MKQATDGLDEIKRAEKEALAELLTGAPEAGKAKASADGAPGGKKARRRAARARRRRAGQLWLGLALIALGALALFNLSQGRALNPWAWWPLLFLVKPLFFGWGWGWSWGCRQEGKR